MIKRLIFDVDGTLITGVSFKPAIENTLRKINSYTDNYINRFLEAISTYEQVYNSYTKEAYINYFSETIGIKLDDEFLRIFFQELRMCVPLENEHLKLTIKELYKEYELVLLTNYFKESQMNRLSMMGLNEFFLECFGEKLIKPNDEIYFKSCGVNHPSECVMIGDDPYLDIKKAQSLGMNTIWVNSKGIYMENLNTITVNRVEEISTNLIKSLTKNQY